MEVWLFIFGYLIHFTGSVILLWKILQQRSTYGLSFDTQICFLLSTISRCIWSLDTRLVETYLAYLELCCSTLIVSFIVYNMYRYRHTNTKSAWWLFRWPVIVPVAGIAALLVHPGKAWWSVQILVAFTIYLEALALTPQLWLMRNMIEIEPLTSHYVGLLVLSRVVRLFFWITLFLQGEHFYGLFIADLLHSFLSADYFILWCRKIRHGGSLIYKM